MSEKIVLFDNETTGLLMPDPAPLAQQPSIIEFYGVALNADYEIISEFETFIKPPGPISEKITEITGITNDMLEDAPNFAEVVGDISDLFHGSTELVAHNASFDVGMLMVELTRLHRVNKFPWPVRHTCTVERSMSLRGRRLRLGQLHEIATGQPLANAHRAKSDVFGLVRCFHWLRENGHMDTPRGPEVGRQGTENPHEATPAVS